MRRLWLAAIVLCTSCRTATPPEVPSALEPDPLAGALTRRNTDTPVIELRIAYQGGSVDDPPGKEGLTFVTATTMLEGRAGEVSFAERERLLFPMAAEITAHVEREQTVFSARVHRDHLAQFYPLLRDLLLTPRFDAPDVDRVRARMLSTLTQDLRGADDESLGKEVLQSMLFEGHPYAHPELGTERGLEAIARDDVERQWSRLFCSARVRIAVAGPVDDAFVAGLSRDLAMARDQDRCEPQSALPPPSSISTRRVWIVDKPEAASVAVSVGVPIGVTRAHPDFAALALSAAYLGQHRTFAGRLMQKIRGERGLNYGDYAYAEHFVQAGDSRFPQPNVARRQQYFSLWLRPVAPEHAHFALRMAVRELELFLEQGICEADFARMQQFVDHYFALFAQTEQQRLGYALDDSFYGLDRSHLDALREQVRALTREQMMAAAKRHLALSRLQIAIIAPNARALADALVEGKPSPIGYNVEKSPEVLAEDKLVAVHPLVLTREQVNIVPVSQVFK